MGSSGKFFLFSFCINVSTCVLEVEAVWWSARCLCFPCPEVLRMAGDRRLGVYAWRSVGGFAGKAALVVVCPGRLGDVDW